MGTKFFVELPDCRNFNYQTGELGKIDCRIQNSKLSAIGY
jgi:hypothetical protein